MAAKLSVYVRWAIRRDMDSVQRIEEESFEYPWSESDFIRCMSQRSVIGMVAEHEDRVVGFMVYELHNNRVHLLNLAVHPDYRHRSVGEQMIDKLVAKLQPQRRVRIVLEVRERNLDAQLFFKACGFRAIAVVRDFYEESPEDAIRFQFHVRQLHAKESAT